MTNADAWRKAFAVQAKADFETWEILQDCPDVAKCHKLQFLQMACEKLAKAHLYDAGSQPAKSHAYFGKNFPKIAEYYYARAGISGGKYRKLYQPLRPLAGEIECLSPSVDNNGKRRDNCEYPWEESGGAIRIPAEYTFPNLNLLTAPNGRQLLKIVKEVIDYLTSSQ